MGDVIIIEDWCGNVLYSGSCNDPEVDKVLAINKCTCFDGCKNCDFSGYSGDFSVRWEDESDTRNVYEHINY